MLIDQNIQSIQLSAVSPTRKHKFPFMTLNISRPDKNHRIVIVRIVSTDWAAHVLTRLYTVRIILSLFIVRECPSATLVSSGKNRLKTALPNLLVQQQRQQPQWDFSAL